MKTTPKTALKKTALFVLLMILNLTTAQSATGPYFGQSPPGNMPVVFAPGILSLTNRSEARIAFSPDGTECYFGTQNVDWTNMRIYRTTLTNGVWTSPALASFSVSQQTGEPFFSQDGNQLYFTSFPSAQAPRLFLVNRTPQGWSTPALLPSPIYSGSVELCYSQAADGTAYFVSMRAGGYGGMDLYQTYLDSSQTLRVKNLGSPWNSAYNDRDPCIAPDGSYLIFSSSRASQGIYGELYASFTNGNGGWTAPVNMNTICAGINMVPGGQFEPSLSPEGKYLFFSRESSQGQDIYWVANPFVPQLAITRNDTNVHLSWSTNLSGFVLESVSQLGEAWTPVPGVTGYSATLPANAESQFFRLRK